MSDQTIVAARLYACRKAPYLAPSLFGLQMEPAKLEHVMCVNATGRCRYDQNQLVAKGAWNVPMLAGLMVHEVWHVLRRHFVRGQAMLEGLTPPAIEGELAVIFADVQVLFNIAADLSINDGMVQQGFQLPKWGCFAKMYDWPELETMEFYFQKLLQASQKEMDKLAAHLKKIGMTPDEFADLMRRPCDEAPVGIARTLNEKATAERMRQHANRNPGSMPGDQERWAGLQLLPPKVRWEDELRHGLRSLLTRGDMDYSWRRTNRRKSGDLLFPGLTAHRPTVAVIEDTSGSMGEGELQRARSETAAVLKALQTPVTVLCCDAAVASVQKLYNINQLKLVGGGGTDMALGLIQAASLNPRPEVVVCLTDGYTGWPAVAPRGCKFITVLVGDGAGPTFGKVIRLQ